MEKLVSGLVCIVTGATRGIGKGIALQLAENGAKVYITGRTLNTPMGSKIGGSLKDTAKEIETRGGHCIPVQCDHSKKEDIERLFERVKHENDGQLDILVNNAYSAVTALGNCMNAQFWEEPMSMWDEVNNVGLRNHYLCSVYAAQLMVPRKRGLIINVSSIGGFTYAFCPAYGIGKEACDRMAVDCGLELRKHNIAFISLWPMAVSTETLVSVSQELPEGALACTSADINFTSKRRFENFSEAETPAFVGKCVVGLARDRNIMKKACQVVMTCDLGREYGLQDEKGHRPDDPRQINNILRLYGYHRTAWFIPNFIRVPKFIMTLYYLHRLN